MRFRSTGPGSAVVGLKKALLRGQSPHGGLYQPDALPPFPPGMLETLRSECARNGWDPAETGVAVLDHLWKEVEGLDHALLGRVVREALDFPIPLVRITEELHLLELFHGPTLAFKDVGARVMAALLTGIEGAPDPPVTIMAATSGDTGGAVAAAFAGCPGVQVVVLFPRGQVSLHQRVQFTTLGGNVLALAVEGDFDACQRLAREAFAHGKLRTRHRLTSANSINVGRLLPQIIYFVHAWIQLGEEAGPPIVAVPSGNFGNLTAGLMARKMGLPVTRFVAATNVNDTVPRYLTSGRFEPAASRRTISSAMDVGHPSNFERILDLYDGDREALAGDVVGRSATDGETRACIQRIWRDHGRIVDPHTAVGILGLESASPEIRRSPGTREPAGIVLATAHPAKFPETVEPLVGGSLRSPTRLAHRLAAKEQMVPIEPTLDALEHVLDLHLP